MSPPAPARCLPWLEGESSHKLLIAAARLLAQRKPAGAAAALLAYLPYADQTEVIAAVNAALVAVAAPAGKPDPALLRGLSDALGVRRAAAVSLCAAPCRPIKCPMSVNCSRTLRRPCASARRWRWPKPTTPKLSPSLSICSPMPPSQRQDIEEFLGQLAGEWTPIAQLGSEDKIARKIRRDAWQAWWKNTEGEALLGVVREHTLTPEIRQKISGLS